MSKFIVGIKMENSLIYQKFKFIFKIVLRFILGCFVEVFIWKDKNLILIGNYPLTPLKTKRREQFLHNTKYLFLYLNQESSGLKYIYLCDDEIMYEHLKNNNIKNVCRRKSLKGLYYTFKAKYWVTDYDVEAVNAFCYSFNAKVINLWHGIPLKKIVYDEQKPLKDFSEKLGCDFSEKQIKFINLIRACLRPRDDYYIVNSEYEQTCYSSAFLESKDKIKIIGSPRLDVLLHDVKHADLCMEEDFVKIKSFKEEGKKIFIYMPTWRDSGKDISGWLKSDKLRCFLNANNIVLVCKLHPADKNSLDFNLSDEFYKMSNNSDIYSVLKYSDALITDYSSVYFDYLLLDKPIIYYPTDLKEYVETRGLYSSYDELTAGAKAFCEEDLLKIFSDIVIGKDDYVEQRKNLRNLMFENQDGNNCQKVIEWIKNLK